MHIAPTLASVRSIMSSSQCISGKQLKADLRAFVQEHGPLPRETPKLPVEEVKLARRCRRARKEGTISADDLNSLHASPNIMQEARDFVAEHGRLPREYFNNPADEVKLAYRIRIGIRDGKIDADELKASEGQFSILQEVRDFVAEHGS